MSAPSRAITLGVHVGHDAAAAVFVDARLCFAEEEERHSRQKAQGGCPWGAIAAGLEAVGAREEEVGTLALTWKIDRYLECRLALAQHARQVGNEAWFAKRQRETAVLREAVAALRQRFPKARVADFAHHHAHLACAVHFAPPASKEAAPALGVVADALGDAESATAFLAPEPLGLLGNPELVLRRSPEQSIGFFYKRASEAFGFSGSEACGYLMALSGCGHGEELAEVLRRRLFEHDRHGLRVFRADGFDPFRGHSESASRCFPADLLAQLGLERPVAEGELASRAGLANAFQQVTEEYLEELLVHLATTHRPGSLLVSGGVFLNCVALERICGALPGLRLVVCPVKCDSGTAIGAGVLAEVARRGGQALDEPQRGLRLGTPITGAEPDWSAGVGGTWEPFATRQALVAALAEDVASGALVALADGPGEFGRRALGARSILATPASPALAAHLNRQVKCRHAFQPFAGAFLEEDFRREHPGARADAFMSYAVRFGPEDRDRLAGILHRDWTSRVQLVPAAEESILRALLLELRSRGAASVVLNTSLNARGEPMPRTAAEVKQVCAQLGLRRIYTPLGRWSAA